MAVDTYALTSLANLKAHLGVTTTTDDSIMESYINRASARIEAFCDRQFVSRTYSEWRHGVGRVSLPLRRYPVISTESILIGEQLAMTVSMTTSTDVAASVSILSDVASPSVVLRRTNSSGVTTATALSLATYPTIALLAAQINLTSGFSASASVEGRSIQLRPVSGVSVKKASAYLSAVVDEVSATVEAERGILNLDWGSWGHRPQSILVEYTAGYATTPYDIEQACVEIAAALFHSRKRDENLASQSLGDYSHSFVSTGDLGNLIRERLGRWRAIR